MIVHSIKHRPDMVESQSFGIFLDSSDVWQGLNFRTCHRTLTGCVMVKLSVSTFELCNR